MNCLGVTEKIWIYLHWERPASILKFYLIIFCYTGNLCYIGDNDSDGVNFWKLRMNDVFYIL